MKLIYKLRALAALLIVCALVIGLVHGFVAGAAAFVIGGLAVQLLDKRSAGPHLFIYTGTRLADIFIPSVYGTIRPNDSPETTLFAESGVAVTNEVLQSLAQAGARLIEVPYWNDLDASVEPNLTNDTDTNATPGKVSAGSWKARNAFLNKGYGAADLTVELSGTTPGQGDPMTRIRNRFGRYWSKQFQYRLIASCVGILAKNVSTYASDMLYNIAAESTAAQSAATKISADAVVQAAFTLGDQFGGLVAIAMHSAVYKVLVSQDLITFVKNSTGTMDVPTYLGKRVIVDDGLPVRAGTTSGLVYTTMLYGSGALGYGMGSPKVPAEIDRIPAGGNGGGLENIWERVTWLIQPAGWNWLDASVAGDSATLAELRLAANWSRPAGVVRKQIPMAFLQTN